MSNPDESLQALKLEEFTENHLLERVRQGLALTADISRADISLILLRGSMAVVAAQARPHSIASLYKQWWIGREISLDENPLLQSCLLYGRAGHRQVEVLEKATPIVQQALPIRASSGDVVGALQIETNLIAWERQKRRDAIFRKAVVWLQQMSIRGDLASAEGLSPFSEWDGILFVDDAYRIRYVSGIANNLYRRLGYLDNLDGKHIGDLQTKDELLIRDAFRSGTCQEHEVTEGSHYWTRKVAPLRTYGPGWWPLGLRQADKITERGALVMVHDLTEEREKALQLQVLSTMIKEVHHRVKNNLQTVASILRMQGRRATDPEVRLQLAEAVNRVLAVAVIHESLSREDDQTINVKDVCQRIVAQTQRAAVMPDKQINLAVRGPVIYLPSQQATACALVVNELVLNALEHAFDGRSQGSVTVQLTDRGDQVTLEILDDGIGLAADNQQRDSLGLTIVRTLVEGDLKGRFEVETETPGTRAVVSFPKALPGGKLWR